MGNVSSSPEEVISGVPQGSVLGPLFFIIFINDITDAVKNSKLKLYADDSKVAHFTNRRGNCLGLQEDLNNIFDWCNIWQLNLSLAKCSIIRFAPREVHAENLTIGNNDLAKESQIRDLG